MIPPPFGHHWSHFDPRTLCYGVRLLRVTVRLGACTAFQSTHPYGVRYDIIPAVLIVFHISIHAPCGVRRFQNQAIRRGEISIHAPIRMRQAQVHIPGTDKVSQPTHPCYGCDMLPDDPSLAYPHFNPRTHVGATKYDVVVTVRFLISIHAPIMYEYDSTFLHCCGLIGSHVVPIAHSVLSGLDNRPHIKP